MSRKPWYERDGGKRWQSDRVAIEPLYPDLQWTADPESAKMVLQGTIVHRADCGVRTAVPVRIEFPDEYPAKPPRAFDSSHKFVWCLDRHTLEDGSFCLSLTPKTDWQRSNPNALVSFLDQVSIFIDRQIIYDDLPAPAGGGKRPWPGGEWAHGYEGFREYVLELLNHDVKALAALTPLLQGEARIMLSKVCPCGSGRKYGECHQPVVERILDNVPTKALKQIIGKSSGR